MSVDQHLNELEKKHDDLEKQLGDALAHPSVDDSTLNTLKRKKLLLKDEISRLRTTEIIH